MSAQSGLGTAHEHVVALLSDAGLRVADSLATANPPCVWVLPPVGQARFDKRRFAASWEALLLVGNLPTPLANDHLGALLDTLAGHVPVVDVERVTVQPLDGGDPWPGLRVSWRSLITIGGV